MEIYVRYASRAVSEDNLCCALTDFGVVQSATIIKHESTGEPIGIAIIEMSSPEQAHVVLSNLRHVSVAGAPLILDEGRTGIGRQTGQERRSDSRARIDLRVNDRRDSIRANMDAA